MHKGIWFYYLLVIIALLLFIGTVDKLVRFWKLWPIPDMLRPYANDKKTQDGIRRRIRVVYIFFLIALIFALFYYGRDLPAALQKDYLEVSGEVVSCVEETPKKVQGRDVKVRDEQSGEIVDFYFSTRYIDAGTHIEVTYLPFTEYVVEARVYS